MSVVAVPHKVFQVLGQLRVERGDVTAGEVAGR
jgi:hypothetical protein